MEASEILWLTAIISGNRIVVYAIMSLYKPFCRGSGLACRLCLVETERNKQMSAKFKDLITSVDVMNTLNGGISEPFLSIFDLPDGRELRIRIPGVGKEALRVEINNTELSIFYLIPVLSDSRLIQVPQIVYHHKIPHTVEPDGIKAVFEGNDLVVKMPFSKLTGFNRTVPIDKE